MAKTQVQLNREHIARIRRKARAFDKLTAELKAVAAERLSDHAEAIVLHLVKIAEKQAGE